jgi:metal-dependent amidase/aminoacylase/carboxypeptidase family protein
MTASVDRWADVYRDVHAHPELGFAETRTAGIAESHLSSMGFEVTAGVGGTGVVGLFRNGRHPACRDCREHHPRPGRAGFQHTDLQH